MFRLNQVETEPLLRELAELLTTTGTTLASAESCTGGMIAALMTWLPGSSDWYRGGISSYSNDAKIKVLGVPEALLDKHGAVSQPVAESMAGRAAALLKTDWAVAVTGIAGPGGGSPDKPVGTVHVAWLGPDGLGHEHLRLQGDRHDSRAAVVRRVLDRLISRLQKQARA